MFGDMNKQISREFYSRYPDLDGAMALTADGFVLHQGDRETTAEEFTQTESALVAAAPDAKVVVLDQIAEDDTVVTRWAWSGTFRNPWMGMPATGAPLAFTAVVIDRIKDGEIAERWVEADSLGLLTQLGLIPPMG